MIVYVLCHINSGLILTENNSWLILELSIVSCEFPSKVIHISELQGLTLWVRFAEKCTPALVGSFIYMFHPDGLDAFDSYFGSISRFTESREATMWTTSITISQYVITPQLSLTLDRETRYNMANHPSQLEHSTSQPLPSPRPDV